MLQADLQGKIVTVIGGSGFLGRYIVGRLLKAGALVRVACRDRDSAQHLKPLAGPNMLTLLSVNITDSEALRLIIKDSDYVINLVGIIAERGRQKFQKIHIEGAERVAKICHEMGVKKLIYFSALGASQASKVPYARTKALAEARVLKHFPHAFILRPSLVFGPHDHFFTKMALLARLSPILPIFGRADTKFQPIYAGDIAIFTHKLLVAEKMRHRIFELGGADIVTMKELLHILLVEVGYRRMLIRIPYPIALILGKILSLLPKSPLTAEQVRLLQIDNIVDSRLPGLELLGVRPQTLISLLPSYMDAYCKGGRYASVRQHYHAALLAEEASDQVKTKILST